MQLFICLLLASLLGLASSATAESLEPLYHDTSNRHNAPAVHPPLGSVVLQLRQHNSPNAPRQLQAETARRSELVKRDNRPAPHKIIEFLMLADGMQKLDLDNAERTLLQEVKSALSRYSRAQAQLNGLELERRNPRLTEAELVKKAPAKIQEDLKEGTEARKHLRSLVWQWAKDLGAVSETRATLITWDEFDIL